MPLASKDGKLYVKDGKLCTSCCGDTPDDFCCVYKYAIVGTVFGNTAEEAIQAAYDSAVWNVENLYPGQAEPTWGLEKSDGTWTQEAGYDSRFDRYFTNPMWIWNTSSPLYEAPECLPSSDKKCTAPFAFPKDGDCSTDCPDITPPTELGCCYVDIGDGTLQSQGRTTKADCQAAQDEVDPSIECTWIADTEETKDQPCPDQPVYPPVPGICLYRDDERGTCTAYYVEGSGGACDEGATLEECYEQQVEPALQESFPPGNGAYYFYYGTDGDEDSLYWEALTVTSSDPAGDFLSTEDECLESVYYSCPDPSFPADAQTVGGSITCQEFADQANALAPYTWANDMPATDCRPVSSEDECTESTGEFCANVTDCNDPSLEISAGCPETQNRRNPLP